MQEVREQDDEAMALGLDAPAPQTNGHTAAASKALFGGALAIATPTDVANRARMALLEILLINLESSPSEFNLTHLLLGFDAGPGQRVERTDLNTSPRRQCLDVLLQLVRKPRCVFLIILALFACV